MIGCSTEGKGNEQDINLSVENTKKKKIHIICYLSKTSILNYTL